MPATMMWWRFMAWLSYVLSRHPVEDVERKQNGGDQQAVFEDDIIEPVTRKRGVGSFHWTLPLASCLCMVVLASHSSPTVTLLRCWAT